MNTSNWVVLTDFDGTISLEDVTDLRLERFAKEGWREIEALWTRGEIGSRACMAAQVSLLDLSQTELDTWLTSIEIDPAFVTFVDAARSQGMAVIVVSDGLDYVIESILRRNGFGSIPIVANRLVQTSERSWRLDFPHAQNDCVKASGTCKCALLKAQQHSHSVLFIGDGASDFCVAHHADALLAKGRLIEYAQQQSIAHVPMNDFGDATQIVHRLRDSEPLALADSADVSFCGNSSHLSNKVFPR